LIAVWKDANELFNELVE